MFHALFSLVALPLVWRVTVRARLAGLHAGCVTAHLTRPTTGHFSLWCNDGNRDFVGWVRRTPV
ncbi:hypothetical protein JOD69_001143 [Methylocaldum sp. RMAD-M]|nr:hypothetical protein [Methylocaldum sp. RMAD-M]